MRPLSDTDIRAALTPPAAGVFREMRRLNLRKVEILRDGASGFRLVSTHDDRAHQSKLSVGARQIKEAEKVTLPVRVRRVRDMTFGPDDPGTVHHDGNWIELTPDIEKLLAGRGITITKLEE